MYNGGGAGGKPCGTMEVWLMGSRKERRVVGIPHGEGQSDFVHL